jgi:preprotein translocase subunit SecG
MHFVVGILTFVLVLICLFLILLVLVQLPKKDAGAGMAFGAGTADALFGAGSGNALTKITKYTAVAFLALALVLGWLQSSVNATNTGADFTKMVEQKQQQATAPGLSQQPKPQAAPPAGNNLLSIPPAATNAPAPAGTNSAK